MWSRLTGGADVEADAYLEPVALPPPRRAATPLDASPLVERYAQFCKMLQVAPNASCLTFLRLHLSTFRPEAQIGPTCAPIRFSDADMFAWCDFLLRSGSQRGAIFEHWETADVSQCAIGLSGAMMLMRVLQLPGCRVSTVDLGAQRIGARGAEALVETIRINSRLRTVRLHGSFIHDEGARCFAELLAGRRGTGAAAAAAASEEGDRPPLVGGAAGSAAASLEELDLSVNMISFQMCEELRLAAPSDLRLVLQGNRVLDEVLNASSHGIGVILVIIGAVYLGIELSREGARAHRPGPDGAPLSNDAYVGSNVIYLVSLFLLYLFSTLYHALFALGSVQTLFQIFDHSCIYLLIAGSYTPYLTILFPDRPEYSVGLLSVLWLCALGGICLNLCYHGKHKVGLQVSSYIGMGWAALFAFGDIWARLSPRPLSLVLLVGGGVAYTAGVPWFVRDRRTLGVPDHTIWHLFVLAASVMHYFCVLWFIVRFPFEGEPAPWDVEAR